MKLILTAAALAALTLSAAACDKRPEPQGETTGAAMPDTSQSTPVAGPSETAAPDAGDTGVVPADGSKPPMEANPPAASAPATPPAK